MRRAVGVDVRQAARHLTTSRDTRMLLLRMVLNHGLIRFAPDPADPPNAPGVVTLDALRVGEAGVVREVVGEGPELVRLRVMGVCAGQGVHTLRGGPRMIVCVGGTRIGLDRSVARRVRVVPVKNAPT